MRTRETEDSFKNSEPETLLGVAEYQSTAKYQSASQQVPHSGGTLAQQVLSPPLNKC
jgi:hypothetical protein